MLSHPLHYTTLPAYIAILVVQMMIVSACATASVSTDAILHNTPVGASISNKRDFPTLSDFWNGDAEFRVIVQDTGLPMGESDTVVLSDGTFRSYVHASARSIGAIDSCGEPVPFPGCVVAYISNDGGYTFAPTREDGVTKCMIPCRTCPCESERDHIDQQQYPRVINLESFNTGRADWLMVYEYRGSVFLRVSDDGLEWSEAEQLPTTGIWQTWLMPCRPEETIGPHPYAPDQYDCLVGGPPGLFVTEERGKHELYIFVALGQNPSSMGCYRGSFGGDVSTFHKCQHNPLFTAPSSYGHTSETDAVANEFFAFRTISSAELVQIDEQVYMLYEGVRGPGPGDAGDTQFALGLARTITPEVDSPWQTYPGNPILVDLPGNIGLGHADLVLHEGKTILYTSLDGVTRSRLELEWK